MAIETFSIEGSKKCSHTDVHQYSEGELQEQLKGGFDKLKSVKENHMIPFHTLQNFFFIQKTRKLVFIIHFKVCFHYLNGKKAYMKLFNTRYISIMLFMISNHLRFTGIKEAKTKSSKNPITFPSSLIFPKSVNAGRFRIKKF